MSEKVLHDFDNPCLSGTFALKRGLLLIVYALSRKLPILKRFCKSVYEENLDYSRTLNYLDQLLGIKSIFGINDHVSAKFPTFREELEREGASTVRHWHVSKDEVHWDPELDVPRSQWWFDKEYAAGRRGPSLGEWLVFHCDYPYLLPAYIHCIYQLRKQLETRR